MRNQAILALILAMNTLSATASSCDPKLTGEPMNLGKRYYSHSFYSLHRLDVGDIRTFDDTKKLGNLQLVGGTAPRMSLNSEHGTLNELTLESAKKLFGEPSFIYDSPRNPLNQLATFNFKTLLDRNEPNIFHLDMEIARGGKAQHYRIRGIDTSEPAWITLAAE